MAWVMRNLFIEDAPDDEGVMTPLRQLIAENRSATPLTLSSGLDGWRAVSGAGGWLDDLPAAAQTMAKKLGRRVLSCELVAHSFLLRIGEHQGDGTQKLLQSPELPWGAAEPHRGEMPLYEDVEQRAFTTLLAMGVPRDLVLLGVPALTAQGQKDLGKGLQLHNTEEGAIEERSCSVSAPALAETGDAPVVPRERDAGFGLSLNDDRYVEGRPSDRAVDRLVELEEGMLARARSVVPDTEIRLTLVYYAGSFQAELDRLLHARDRFVPISPRPPTTPWWQFWRHIGFKRR